MPEQNFVEASQAVSAAQILHGPESTTLQPGKTGWTGELPPLANVSFNPGPQPLLSKSAHLIKVASPCLLTYSSLQSTAMQLTRPGSIRPGRYGDTRKPAPRWGTYHKTALR